MAIDIPVVFTTRTRKQGGGGGDGKRWRLPQDHVEDLRDVARGVEETNVGIACRYIIDLRSGSGSDYDEVQLDDVERFCNSNDIWNDPSVDNWRRRIERCRRALRKMQLANEHKYVSVLYIVYGYPDPSTRHLPQHVRVSLGDLAGLAKYTDVVEVHRQELARLEAVDWVNRTSKVSNRLDTFVDEDERVVAVRNGFPVEASGHFADLLRHRERFEWVNRVLTSYDALCSIFLREVRQERGETKEHFLERKINAEKKMDGYLLSIKQELLTLHEMACRSYHAAWLASTG